VLSTGHVLDNRYRLDERIATGGMGDVWRGTDLVLGRVIAVKVLRSAMLADPEFAARFYGEARMMAAFRHPGVVEVYDYSSGENSPGEDGCAYLVMAYVEGEPLSTRLKEAGRLGVAETMSIVAQAAEALHAAHEHGTVHRDVKPGNLIVKPNGTVILVDFGVARSAAVTSVTGLNAIVGTALYMAPEQVTKGNVTPATDIYALGSVAYHCIAGQPPFDGDNALQVALRHLEDEPEPLPEDVPLSVRQLIGKAMAKNPEDRFGSADEFAAAALATAGPLDHRSLTGTGTRLTALTTPLAPAAPFRTAPVPGALPVPPRRPRSRAELAVRLAVLSLVLLAVGLGVALLLQNDSGDQVQPTPPQQVVPTESVSPSETATDEPSVPANPLPVRPNGANVRPTRTRTSSAPATSSAPSRTPTTPATTEAPTTKPATPTPTIEPTTPAATGTPGGDTGDGGDGAGGAGGET
jgi:serine/threonine-protein kinase